MSIFSKSCVVCYTGPSLALQFGSLPCCKQELHEICLTKWLKLYDGRGCPVCRSRVDPKDIKTIPVDVIDREFASLDEEVQYDILLLTVQHTVGERKECDKVAETANSAHPRDGLKRIAAGKMMLGVWKFMEARANKLEEHEMSQTLAKLL